MIYEGLNWHRKETALLQHDTHHVRAYWITKQYYPKLPGTEMSATSSRALHTGVAVPSSHKASYAAKKDVADFLLNKSPQKINCSWIRI